MAASRRSRAILRPQRPRDTKVWGRFPWFYPKHQGMEDQGALCSQVRSFLPWEQKGNTPRNFDTKRLFRTL